MAVVAIVEIKFVPVLQPVEVVVNWGSMSCSKYCSKPYFSYCYHDYHCSSTHKTSTTVVVKVEEAVVEALTAAAFIACESTCNISSKVAHRCPLSVGKCQFCQFMRDMHEVGCLA